MTEPAPNADLTGPPVPSPSEAMLPELIWNLHFYDAGDPVWHGSPSPGAPAAVARRWAHALKLEQYTFDHIDAWHGNVDGVTIEITST